MIHLKVLNLDGNPLGSSRTEGSGEETSPLVAPPSRRPFPDDWSGMKRLEELYMRQCQISHLPSRMPPSLVVWHLSSNPLGPSMSQQENDYDHPNTPTTTSVWHHLPRLTHLSLNSCQLTCVPPGLVQGLLVSSSNHHHPHPPSLKCVLSHNPSLLPESLPVQVLHAVRAHDEFQSGPEIVWYPNPQLDALLLLHQNKHKHTDGE